MDSARNDLIEELANGTTGLAAMSAGSPYTYQFKTISRDPLAPHQCSAMLPAAIVLAQGEPKTRQETATRMIRDLQVSILIYAQQDDTSRSDSELLCAIAAEVKHVLIGTANHKHGGKCLMGFFEDMDELGRDDHGEICVALMQFSFPYTYLRDTP